MKHKDSQHVIDTFKAGDVIECKNEKGTILQIVGDVNVQGGVCDDCSIRYDYDEIKVVGRVFTLDELERLTSAFTESWPLEFLTDEPQPNYPKPKDFISWLRENSK